MTVLFMITDLASQQMLATGTGKEKKTAGLGRHILVHLCTFVN